jgi:hypothetical protein
MKGGSQKTASAPFGGEVEVLDAPTLSRDVRNSSIRSAAYPRRFTSRPPNLGSPGMLLPLSREVT